jgi:hypothetical protein
LMSKEPKRVQVTGSDARVRGLGMDQAGNLAHR